MKESQTWDYKDTSIFNVRLLPDLIPVIGVVTYLERMRKADGDSIADFYNLRELFKKEAYTQPKPTDQQAAIRSWILAARINVFVFYHVLSLVNPVIFRHL